MYSIILIIWNHFSGMLSPGFARPISHFLNYIFACVVETVPYVDIIYDGGSFQYPKLPAIHDYVSEDDVSAFLVIFTSTGCKIPMLNPSFMKEIFVEKHSPYGFRTAIICYYQKCALRAMV